MQSELAFGIGLKHEATLTDTERKRGAHYTAPRLAHALCELTLDRWSGSGVPLICDPSCGGGAFLIGAAEALVRRGVSPTTILNGGLIGIDVDPKAIDTTRAALEAWAGAYGVAAHHVCPHLVVADALVECTDLIGGIDVVVGNPPFQSQLSERTSRSEAARVGLVARFGPAAAGYVDSASLFVRLVRQLLRPGGVATLIQPRSFLATASSGGVRDDLISGGELEAVWIPGNRLFAAAVDVCAVVFSSPQGSGQAGAARTRELRTIDVLGDLATSEVLGALPVQQLLGRPWSSVVALAAGVPQVDEPTTAPANTVARFTAGFRDEYYAIAAATLESGAPLSTDQASFDPQRWARVVTTKMVDPAEIAWGSERVRFAKQDFLRPMLDLALLESQHRRVSAWVQRLLVPKVLIATQTSVIEAGVDTDGDCVPVTPVIAALPGDVDPFLLAAALMAPPATVWAYWQFGGSALSSDALKLAARQVGQVPLPQDRSAWNAAADVLRGWAKTPGDPRSWESFAVPATASWGDVDERITHWWLERLPSQRSRRRSV